MSPRDIPAALWLALLLFGIPIVSIRLGRRTRGARPGADPPSSTRRVARLRDLPRPQLYQTAILNQLVLLAITLVLDGLDRWAVLRSALAFPRSGWLWIAGCIVVQQAISFS